MPQPGAPQPTAGNGQLPNIDLVSVCDIAGDIAEATAARYGYSRHDTAWQAIVDADDIDIVSVVVTNVLHQRIVEALLASGKHVLCEKTLTNTVERRQIRWWPQRTPPPRSRASASPSAAPPA